jgi:nitrous oxidase accessory protein NosD
MRKTAATITLALVFLAATGAFAFLPVKAEPRTITVPDDYPTITEAVGNATAGDTIFFKKGTHEGPIDQTVVIDKPLSLIGENAESTILNLHPKYNVTWILTQSFVSSDDAIIINANDVKLMNLTLFFLGEIRANGIRAQIVDNNITSRSTVTGLVIAGSDCNVTNNVVLGRITLVGSSNFVSQNSFYSLILQSSDENIIDSNWFKYFQIDSSNNNTISRNNISYENVQYTIDLRNSTYNLFHGNRVEVFYGITNVRLDFQAQNNTFYGNTFIGNTTFNDQGEIVIADATAYGNFWDNGVYGNFWSNYNGTDFWGDGIGDVPYVIDGNNQDRYPLMKPLLNRETIERPFPTLLVAVVIIVAVFLVVGAGVLLYRRKRRKEAALA